jgi:hypothetical protein
MIALGGSDCFCSNTDRFLVASETQVIEIGRNSQAFIRRHEDMRTREGYTSIR